MSVVKRVHSATRRGQKAILKKKNTELNIQDRKNTAASIRGMRKTELGKKILKSKIKGK